MSKCTSVTMMTRTTCRDKIKLSLAKEDEDEVEMEVDSALVEEDSIQQRDMVTILVQTITQAAEMENNHLQTPTARISIGKLINK